MHLIDTHAHLYVSQFRNDRAEMIQRAVENGINRIYLPAIDSETHEDLLSLATEYPDICMPMIGLHPCHVQPESYDKEMGMVEKYLFSDNFKDKWAAVGEIGLDLYWDKNALPLQQKAFDTQVSWAKDLGLPIVIHSREANAQAIALLQKRPDYQNGGIFHCFSGTLQEAQTMIEMGFYLGIGGVLTYPKSGLAAIVAELPLEKLVLETDAPYLAPVPKRGKHNESAYVLYVAEYLAALKNVSLEEVAKITTLNALQIFKK